MKCILATGGGPSRRDNVYRFFLRLRTSALSLRNVPLLPSTSNIARRRLAQVKASMARTALKNCTCYTVDIRLSVTNVYFQLCVLILFLFPSQVRLLTDIFYCLHGLDQ